MSFVKNDLEQKAREAFLRLDAIVQLHKANNVVPSLGASDIHTEATHLLDIMMRLDRLNWIDDAIKIYPEVP